MIIGGLINNDTGEILETATNRKEMQTLRLKTREMNGEPYRRNQQYGFFEFTGGLGWSKSFTQRDMQVPIPQQIIDWHNEYTIAELEHLVKHKSNELEEMISARDNMASVNGFSHFEYLIDEEINEYSETLKRLKNKITQKKLK